MQLFLQSLEEALSVRMHTAPSVILNLIAKSLNLVMFIYKQLFSPDTPRGIRNRHGRKYEAELRADHSFVY